jgi:Fe-S cluster biogenesis protein NfuA
MQESIIDVTEEKIREALDKIRPYLQQDGGDVEFVDYTDENVVQVRLQGHCAGCPMSQMTVKNGIERLLKEEYPEVASVEAVN